MTEKETLFIMCAISGAMGALSPLVSEQNCVNSLIEKLEASVDMLDRMLDEKKFKS